MGGESGNALNKAIPERVYNFALVNGEDACLQVVCQLESELSNVGEEIG